MKRLLSALAAAFSLGITGCGWMVNWMAREPLPPVIHPIEGLKSFTFLVVNESDSHHVEPDVFRATLTKYFDSRSKVLGADHEMEQSEDIETIHVRILSERGKFVKVNSRTGEITWEFQADYSVALTHSSGKIIWSRPKETVAYFMGWIPPIPSNFRPGWNPDVEEALSTVMAQQLAQQLAKVR